ncbi:hypothetical protein QIS74_01028 [Colletotrichum tabaci]
MATSTAPSSSPVRSPTSTAARIWKTFTIQDFEADIGGRVGNWGPNRMIDHEHTPPIGTTAARHSQFLNPGASARFSRQTPSHYSTITHRQSFPRVVPTSNDIHFPDWLYWEDANRFFQQRPEAFTDREGTKMWEGWEYRKARDILTDYYNLQGRLLRRDWIARDEVGAALQVMVRDLAPVRNVVVVPIGWQSTEDPNITPVLLPQRHEVYHAIRNSAHLVLFPLYAEDPGHFMGLIVDQRDGMVYWYDPMWRSGRSEALFVNDIRALKNFYRDAHAPLHIRDLINSSACVVDSVQQPGGWECGLYVLEWFRSAARYGQMCPTKNPIWRNPSFQGTFGEKLRAAWIEWISYEFRYEGNRPHNAMRDVPALSFEDFRARRQVQPGTPSPKGSDTDCMVIDTAKTPIPMKSTSRSPAPGSAMFNPEIHDPRDHGYDTRHHKTPSNKASAVKIKSIMKDLPTPSVLRTPMNVTDLLVSPQNQLPPLSPTLSR